MLMLKNQHIDNQLIGSGPYFNVLENSYEMWATMWMLEIQSESSLRAVSDLNHRAIYPALNTFLFKS